MRDGGDSEAPGSGPGPLRSPVVRQARLRERAAPARLLGLRAKGHLGVGADADVTVYSRDPDIATMFSTPRYVLKGGTLVVEEGHRRGLLLPQVAVEWGWTPEQFLSQTCVKAGLPPKAWRSGAAVFRFDAEVFGE